MDDSFNDYLKSKAKQPEQRSRFASTREGIEAEVTVTPKKVKPKEERIRIVGTPQYMAPEMTLGKGLDKPAVDYWALGVILFEMLIGCTPFDGDTPEEMFENIRGNKVPWDMLEIGYDEDEVNFKKFKEEKFYLVRYGQKPRI